MSGLPDAYRRSRSQRISGRNCLGGSNYRRAGAAKYDLFSMISSRKASNVGEARLSCALRELFLPLSVCRAISNRGEVMRVVTRQYSGEPWSNADQFFLSNVLASGMSLAEAAGFLGRTEDEVRKYGALISSAQRRNNRRWATRKRRSRLAKPIDVARTRPRSSRRSTSV